MSLSHPEGTYVCPALFFQLYKTWRVAAPGREGRRLKGELADLRSFVLPRGLGLESCHLRMGLTACASLLTGLFKAQWAVCEGAQWTIRGSRGPCPRLLWTFAQCRLKRSLFKQIQTAWLSRTILRGTFSQKTRSQFLRSSSSVPRFSYVLESSR